MDERTHTSTPLPRIGVVPVADEQRLQLFNVAEALAGIGHWRVHVPTNRLYWSAEIFRIYGLQPGEIEPTIDFAVGAYHPDDRATVQAALDRAIDERVEFDFEARILRRSGDVRHVRSIGFCETDEQGTVASVFGVFHDQTERLQAERVISDERRRLQLAADSASLGVWDLDLRTERLVWDPRMFDLLGVDPADFGGHETDWVATLHEEDRQATTEALQRAIADGDRFAARFRIVRANDGAVRHVAANAIIIRDETGSATRLVGINRDITEQVLSDRRFQRLLDHLTVACLLCDQTGRITFANATALHMFGHAPDRLVGRDVTEFLPEESTLGGHRVGVRADGGRFPIQLGSGDMETAEGTTRVLSITDVTEVQRLEHALVHAQRMEAIGQLAGGIAHDFNNLLAVFSGHAELLMDAADDPDSRESIEAIQAAAARGASLTQQLLAYSRRQPLAPSTMDAGEVVRTMEPMLQRTLGEVVRTEVSTPQHALHVRADRHRLEDALLNLAVNARHAMGGSGLLRLRVGSRALGPDFGADGEKVEAGTYVYISVEDDGCGMSDAIREHAFEPFFTTKEVGVGSGLGLSMVQGFVRQSGGHVSIESTVGEGTVVTLYLPATDDLADRSEDPGRTMAARSLEGSVLVVEDDAALRRLAKRMLQQAGLRVTEAEDGVAALAVLASDVHLDLLFTDIVLPGGIDGPTIAERARALRPGIPVLFATGYENARGTTATPLAEDAPLLLKPYARRDLLDRIGMLLRSARRA